MLSPPAAFVIILTAVCVVAKLFPGPCPYIPPLPTRFEESKILHVWHASHVAGSMLHTYSCVKNNITAHPSGLLVNTSLQDESGLSTEYIMAEFTTSTPGIYYTSIPGPDDGTFRISGIESYVLSNGFLLTWGCVNNNDSHLESAFISSNNGVTPMKYIQTFTMYLRRHGSHLKVFNKVRPCKVHSADESAVDVKIKVRKDKKKKIRRK